MIYTSCYSNKNLLDISKRLNLELLSVSVTRPGVYNGFDFSKIRIYNALVPPKSLVFAYKNKEIGVRAYCSAYIEQLDKLDPNDLYNDLMQTVLLCWCGPKQFCHRHLISYWFKKHQVAVEELPYKI